MIIEQQAIIVHTRSTFLQGLLLMDQNSRPIYFHKWNKLFSLYDSWLEKNSCTSQSVCLNFSLSQNIIDKVVVGIDCLSQLNELIQISHEHETISFPRLSSHDCQLINPSFWPTF